MGRVDGDRDTIEAAKRNYRNASEPKTLANYRTWSTLLSAIGYNYNLAR